MNNKRKRKKKKRFPLTPIRTAIIKKKKEILKNLMILDCKCSSVVAGFPKKHKALGSILSMWGRQIS
jgi:hypothetical protein